MGSDGERHHANRSGDESLRAGQDRFVAIWGEMGSSWGIPRTMAEVHALLFITGEALNTDDIMDRLQISRGSASMAVRALLDWGVVHRVHKRGDRKEYFQAEQDVWQMFRTILRERKRREIDPMLVNLYECRDLTAQIQPATGRERKDTRDGGRNDRQVSAIARHHRRLDDLLEFIELIDALSDRFISPSGHGLRVAANLLRKAI